MKEAIRKLFNDCLSKGIIPDYWENSMVILMYKKGDPKTIGLLVSQLNKPFMRIITNRLEKKFELYQPREQDGFRKRQSIIEHI